MESGVPISPKQLIELIPELPPIPAEVIDAVNELLQAKYDEETGIARFDLKDVADLSAKKLGYESREPIYKNNWMDFEPIFEEKGWSVEFHRPAYCETWGAYFVFSAKPPKRKKRKKKK